uniref:Uncharacterized protein n=1 Tax=Arundo donax TaxID=35708 RepID=A0A0A8Z7K8_ARUDO
MRRKLFFRRNQINEMPKVEIHRGIRILE